MVEIIVDPEEISHDFTIDGVKITVFLKNGEELEWLVDDEAAPFDFSSKGQAFRDQLQKEIDVALKKLRAKHGHRVGVFGRGRAAR